VTAEQYANPPAAQTTITQITALLLPVTLGVYLLITSTTDLSDSLWQYDAKRMLQLYLLPLMFLLTLLAPSLRQAFAEQVARIPRWMGWALALMFSLGVISAWHNSTSSMGLAYSLADVALLFLVIAAALTVAACRNVAGEIFDRIVIVLIAMVGVALGLQELIGVLAAWNAGLEFNFENSLVYFAFPRFYNQVQSWTIPVLAALPLVFNRNRMAVLLCVIALALNWFVMVETGGRGSALGVTCAIIVAALLSPIARRTYLRFQLLGLLLGLLIFGSISYLHAQRDAGSISSDSTSEFTQNDGIVQREEEISLNAGDGSFVGAVTGKRVLSSSGRTWMWRGSWEDAKKHPLLGIGPMNYACMGPPGRAAHPHNFPIQFLAEWGFPALLLLLISGAYLAFRLLLTLRHLPTEADKRTSSSNNLSVALGTGIMAAAIHACFSGVLIMPASQVTGILITGWFLGSLPQGQNTTYPSIFGKLILVLGLAISSALLWFGAQQVTSNIPRYEAMDKPGRLLPRFWQFGKDCRLESQK